MQKNQEKEGAEKRASQEAELLQPYEQQRKNNIARNERVLSQIQQGLQPAAQGAAGSETPAVDASPRCEGDGQGKQHPIAASTGAKAPQLESSSRKTNTSAGGSEAKSNSQLHNQKASPLVVVHSTDAIHAAEDGRATALDASPRSEGNAYTQAPNQKASAPVIERVSNAAQAAAQVGEAGDKASPRYAGVVGSQQIAGNLEHETVPIKKVQPHRTCKKPKPAQISKHAKAQGKDRAASASAAEGKHGAIPDILGPSAEEQLPASASGSSKAKGKSLKRAHRGRCDQSQQKPARQLSKSTKRRKKGVA